MKRNWFRIRVDEIDMGAEGKETCLYRSKGIPLSEFIRRDRLEWTWERDIKKWKEGVKRLFLSRKYDFFSVGWTIESLDPHVICRISCFFICYCITIKHMFYVFFWNSLFLRIFLGANIKTDHSVQCTLSFHRWQTLNIFHEWRYYARRSTERRNGMKNEKGAKSGFYHI